MKEFCKTLEIKPEDHNQDQHNQAYIMRHKDKKTYKEISDILGVKLELVSFYVNSDPTQKWVLADWITDYHIKDSSIYEKIDILIDNDKLLVERFKRAKRTANYVEQI